MENPISGGSAVYAARVMLGLDVDDFVPESGNRFEQQPSQLISSTNIKEGFYPNPANNVC